MSNSGTWPWQYFQTQTTGDTPQTQGGLSTGSGSFVVEASSGEGQSVVRGFFAYIATDPINATITANVTSTHDPDEVVTPDNNGENRRLIARLYSPNGGVLATYFDTTSASASASIELPATTCPKVLWVGAAAQPYGFTPAPATTAKVTFLGF
jgi:hypothetical protein